MVEMPFVTLNIQYQGKDLCICVRGAYGCV